MEEMAKEVNLAIKTLKDGTLPDPDPEPALESGGESNAETS